MASNVYQPFKARDEIRLLSLLPNEQGSDEPIQCRFQHVNLTERPKYEALSYTWGDQTIQHPVIIDASGNTVNVGQNCYSALRSLRKTEEPRLLWIDALCINQANQDEKATQVPIMGHVYACATKTIILLQYDGPDKAYHGKGAGPELQRCWDSSSDGEESSPSDLDEGAKKELFDVANYPWFHRAWIVQETLLSGTKQVLCPPFEWNWEYFSRQAPSGYEPEVARMNNDYWINKYERPNPAWDGQLADRDAGELSPTEALGFLVDTREFKCSIHNDRVYSLLSLFQPPLLVPVNYADSKEQVHNHLTGALIRHGESRFWYSPRRESWRVDWDQAPKDLVGRDIRYLAMMRSSFQAKREARWSAIEYLPGYGKHGAIRSLSFKVGEVTRLSQTTFGSRKEYLKQQWRQIMSELELPVDERESGVYPVVHIQKRNHLNVPWYRDWVPEVKDDSDDGEVGDEHNQRKRRGTSAVFLKDRPVFVCGNNGVIGVGTQGLRIGDGIWYVCGLNTPVCALRRVETMAEEVDSWGGMEATMVGLCFLSRNDDLKAINPMDNSFPYGGPELVWIV